jgi:uncharacterized membrane protein
MNRSSLRRTLAVAALGLAAPLLAFGQAISLVEVGTIRATGMSEDGRNVVGYRGFTNRVVRWTEGGGTLDLGRNTFGKTGGGSGDPAISRDGQAISATIMDDTRTTRIQGRWTLAGGWQQLVPLPADAAVIDSEVSTAFGMSGDGQVVTGFYWTAAGLARASTWREGQGVSGFDSPGVSARIDGANQDGSVLVGWEENATTRQRQPAVWVNGVRTFLDGPEGFGEASSVNAEGTVIVGQGYDRASGRSMAVIWRWNGRRWVRSTLGVLKGTSSGYSYATGVSDDGRIVVGFNRAKFSVFETEAFIWTEASGMVRADDWVHSRGKDIRRRFAMRFMPAINGAGTAILAVGEDRDPPFTQRSLVIRLKEDSAAVPAAAAQPTAARP